jgi:hypothetical protein
MKVVLSVVDPEYPSGIHVEEVVKNRNLLKSAIKLAERNGLYYYFIYRLKELGADSSFLEKERWNEEERKLSGLKNTITLLNKVSKDYGIEYIIIKACNTIPHIPRDVDIFVRNEDRTKIIEALEDNGMRCIYSGVTETALKGDYMKVDVYTEICYIGVDFMDGRFLRQSSVKDEVFGTEYYGLNNEANLLLLLVHSLFGHRSMSLLDFLHIKHIRGDINIDGCRAYAYKMGWESVFDLVLNELDTLNERIYTGGAAIRFPYLFDINFILKCVSRIEGLNMGGYNKIFLHATLVQDRVIYELKDTPIYNLLKAFEPTRHLINSLTASVKVMRGDRKSVDEERNRR